MPGNEVGDRVHNFFHQGNLSQNQHQTQAVEANWTVFNNKPWGASNRQIAGLFGSKNYNTHQTDSERGEGNQFPLGPYGLNSAQSNPTPVFSKSQSHNQSPSLNGFIHTPHVSRTRNNEENAMGFDTQSDRCYPISRGLSTLDSQQRSGPQHNNPNSVYFGTIESPVNFDFLGNQHQMSSQQLGPLQSLSGQQSGINDIQQMQQQFMLKQVQELQRHHQLQQLEALHRNSLHQIPNISNQTVNHPPALINETSMHDGRSSPWSSQVIPENPNWLQRGASAAVQSYSNGIMIIPEQGQALQFNNLVPQQVSQSLYGVPVNSTWAAAPFFHGQIDKPGMQHVLAHHSSHSANQHALFPEQTSSSIQGGATELKQGFANKSSFQSGFGPGSGEVNHVEYSSQTQQRNVSVQESRGTLGLTGSSELSDRTVNHVCSSKAAVALDPTEEKILYGSDDNIWEAFGGSLATVGDSSDHLDGAFSSLQSGSWSALMQSAVAECASSKVMQQGAWGGVGIQNSGSLAANQHISISQDSRKHLAAWVDDSQAASLTSKPIANDASASNNIDSAVIPSFLNEPRVSLKAISAHQSSGEGINWLGNSQPQAPAEARQVKNVYSSAELHSKGSTGSWSHEQNLSLHGNESIHRTNAFRIIETSTENGVTISKPLDSLGHDRSMSVNVGHAGTLSNQDSAPNSNIGFLDPMFNSKGEAVIRSSISVKVNQESMEKLLENHNLNFWGRASSVKSGTDELKYHQQVGQSPQVLDSSLSSSVRGRSEMFEIGNVDRRENSSDSHSSNISHHALPGSFRQNSGSDIGKNGFPGERQKLSVPGGIKCPGPHKLQHHPMVDVDMDEELVYGRKHPLQSEVISHPIFGGIRSQERQLMLQLTENNSLTSAKGLASNVCGNATASSGHPSSASHSGYMTGASGIDKPMSSSQNMLELLHKVDQSNDQNSFEQLSSSTSTGAAERESSDGTVRQPKLSSASHSQPFGLQLAPPSQGLLVPYFMVAGQNSSEKVNFASLNVVPSGAEDKATAWMSLGADTQNFPPLQKTSKVGTFTPLAPGFGDTRSQLQIQQRTDAGGKIIDEKPKQLADVPLTCAFGSTVPNVLGSQKEVSQLTNLEQQDVNLSTSAPVIPANNMTQQQLLGAQFVRASNLFMPQQPDHSTEPRPITQQEQDCEGALGRQNTVTSCAIISGKENLGREVDEAVKLDNSLSKSCATQKQIEAFGRSLKPNNHVPDNYSMLQHMQAVKAAEMTHGDRQLKRLKISDNSPDAGYNVGQMFSGGLHCVVRNGSASSELVSPGDAMMSNISPEANSNQDNGTSSQVHPVNISLQDKNCDGKDLHSADTEPIVRHPQISPRGAPTWFGQQGTFKSVQSSQTFSSLQQQYMSSDSKNFITDHPLGRVNAAIDAGHIGESQRSITTSVMGNQFCSHHPPVPSVIAPTVETPRLRKRKSATSALLPWHEEVALSSQGVQTTSSAEERWAREANRLTEKHEDETDINGGMSLVNRSRRRLILTTQLMQQLLHTPPAAILSLDASSNYETVAYFVARLVLGDACGMACSASNSHLGNENSLSVKPVTSGRTHDRYFSKLVEDFTNRARKLEDMLRLDTQALTLDLRLECQDLDRLSVINHFAKFHGGRVQASVAETSLSSTTAAVMQKPIPRRYITAHPVPMNLPDGVQCLSL